MSTLTRLALAVFVLSLAACDCGSRSHPPADSPCLGLDCDDPCADGDCPRCNEDPAAAGCPCGPDDQPAVCYAGARETANVGLCQVGLRTCHEGAWTPCEGQVLPTEEICDEIDNDCDGTVDDGVLGPCGDCSQDCSELAWGHEDGETPFSPDATNSSGVGLRDPGALVLLGDELALRVLWVANSPQGTVSLVDTGSRTERARYRTGPDAQRDDPSRTSVGYLGHAYVGNRASYGAGAGDGAVTKILEHGCPDRDGDGVVETSHGRDDVLDWGQDECVAWRTVIGDGHTAVRAVAAQVKQDAGEIREVVWAGTTYQHEFHELDGETGEPTGLMATIPCSVYGAALAPDGNMWVSCFLSGGFARFDTYDPTDTETFASATPYGLAVAPDGRVWLSDGHVYDPAEHTITSVAGAYGRGVATDLMGSVWFGECGGGTCRIDAETLVVENLPMASRGIAVDFDGYVWGVPYAGDGSLTVMDPDDETYETVLDDCEDGPCLVMPYTYSDMTGTQLLAVTTPFGAWETLVEGCAPDQLTRWVRVDWDAELPPDTSVRLQVRAADALESLASEPWIDVATDPPDPSPAALAERLGDRQHAAFLGVRAVLGTAVHGQTPAVHRVAVQRSCGSVFR